MICINESGLYSLVLRSIIIRGQRRKIEKFILWGIHMNFIKKYSSQLYFIAAILFFVIYWICKEIVYSFLGFACIGFGAKYEKAKKRPKMDE